MTYGDNSKRLSRDLPPIQVVIEEVLQRMGFNDFRINLQSSTIPGHISYTITGPNSALLIGRDGRNLQVLSKLIREIVFARSTKGNKRIDKHFELENYVIDVDGYQEKQTQELLGYVDSQIKELAISNESQIELNPMSPFHRRIVHAYVQDKDGLNSESTGAGIERRLVILEIEG